MRFAKRMVFRMASSDSFVSHSFVMNVCERLVNRRFRSCLCRRRLVVLRRVMEVLSGWLTVSDERGEASLSFLSQPSVILA